MARPQATDPLHNFRFHAIATAVSGLGGDPMQGDPVGNGAEAGFQAITIPEYTVESAEYREGTKTYTEKYPGIPSTNDVTFTRGVARSGGAFHRWVLASIEGREYRSDITYFHFVREGRSAPFNPALDLSDANSKRYMLIDALPIRIKPAGDLDATSSDVSLAEMDVAFERFVIANAGEALAP